MSHSTLGAPIEAYAPQKADVETLDAVVLLRVLSEVKDGDFTARMPIHWTGEGETLGLYFGATSGDVFGSGDAGESWSTTATRLPPVMSVSARATRAGGSPSGTADS